MSQSSPEAIVDGVPPSVAAVPGVIRTAAAATRSPAVAPGYSPKLSLDMASAHTWVPYAATIRALRYLTLTSLGDAGSREQARDTISTLYRYDDPPFGPAMPACEFFGREAQPARRFPEGLVYVCLDRPPFSRRMQGIVEPLARAEAAGGHGLELVSACSGFVRGIGDALDELTRGDAAAAVLYDRAVFESAFLLTWTEPAKAGKAAVPSKIPFV